MAKSGKSLKRKLKAKEAASAPKLMKTNLETSDFIPLKKVKKDKKRVNVNKEEMEEKYPLLKDKELIGKFLQVKVTNNQKGRIRQVLKDSLKSSSDELLPEVIHNKIQRILQSNSDLNDTDLRKIRILHNMLVTATEKVLKENTPSETEVAVKTEEDDKKEVVVKKEKKEKVDKPKESENKGDKPKENENKVLNANNKVKGPKRYVVFVGNLPLDINKERITAHFSDISAYIKDVRIPKPKQGKKNAIAYLELTDENNYEMALSKNHSMFENRRINVMYTTQQNTKITKTEAKGKSAKLLALQKSGKLLGSAPLAKKRTFRRNRMKRALAKERKEDE